MNAAKELGAKLVLESKLNVESCMQRSVIFHLFPYIYEAAKRMSTRGIVRWLEANGTKISLATVAKALRAPNQYWQEIYEDIEPAATVVAQAHDLSIRGLLTDQELFFDLIHDKNTFPNLQAKSGADKSQENCDEYLDACTKLQEDWYCLPQTAIQACLAAVQETEKNTNTAGVEQQSVST